MSTPSVRVHVSSPEAAHALAELMGPDYGATVLAEDARTVIAIVPVDEQRRGVVIYRVIQASRTIASQYPDVDLFLETEEGSRWRLPPPAL